MQPDVLPGQQMLFGGEVVQPPAPAAAFDTCAATFSADGDLRYELRRSWWSSSSRGVLAAVLLNPSTADALKNDPTVRRLVGFASRWGFTELRVVNLFARITSCPRELEAMRLHGEDVVGPRNDEYLFRAARAADQILLGWGAHGERVPERVDQVLRVLATGGRDTPLGCLGTTIHGQPRHPLYLKKEEEIVEWSR